MCLMIILKVTKKQGLNHSPENTVLGKPQEGGGQIQSPSLFRVKDFLNFQNTLMNLNFLYYIL